MLGTILYGPPAAGKDTITQALQALDRRYVLFPRLKAGRGRTAGYRMISTSAIDELRARDEIVWENRRYGAVYVVDRPSLIERLADHVPVLHLGQVDAVDAVITNIPDARWVVVYLWCPRDVAVERIAQRGTDDTDARLRAWDETRSIPADITINTAEVTPSRAAEQIHERALMLDRKS